MPIEFSCAACGQKFHVGDEIAGKQVKCTNCGSTIRVPSPQTHVTPPAHAVVPESVPAVPVHAQTVPRKRGRRSLVLAIVLLVVCSVTAIIVALVVVSKSGCLDRWLLDAAAAGNCVSVDRFLAWGADVNTKDADGLTPVALALDKEDLRMAKMLLARGARVGESDASGETPLHRAAAKGSLPIVQFLLDHGANIDSKNDAGWTPLMKAAQQGHTSIAALLIQKGAYIRAREPGNSRTALDFALAKGDEQIAHLLWDRLGWQLRPRGYYVCEGLVRYHSLVAQDQWRNDRLFLPGHGKVWVVVKLFALYSVLDAFGDSSASAEMRHKTYTFSPKRFTLQLSGGTSVQGWAIEILGGVPSEDLFSHGFCNQCILRIPAHSASSFSVREFECDIAFSVPAKDGKKPDSTPVSIKVDDRDIVDVPNINLRD